MKKILYFVAALATVAFTATSCEKKNGGDEPGDGRFVIEIPAVSYNSADIKITAQDTTITYFAGAFSVETIKAFGSDEAVMDSIVALIDATIAYYNEYYKALYEAFGVEWTEEDAFTFEDFITHGNQTYTETGLAAKTDYVEVLFELDKQGKHGTSIYKKTFTTTEFNPSSELKIAIKYVEPNVTFTPSNNTEKYFWNFVSDEELAEYGFATLEEMADDDVNYYGEDITDYLSTGEDVVDLTQYEEAGYIAAGETTNAYAFGYANGARTTEVFRLQVTYKAGSSAAPARHKLQKRLAPKQNVNRLLRK